jgi:2-C-methyl-D-erythritol 4-phosphate cytidylyltransferase
VSESADFARCFALVPCAGVGQRAGLSGPKQYARIGGRSLVGHTLSALARVPRLHATLVVLAPHDLQFDADAGLTAQSAWVAHCGGATRAASVSSGLAELHRRGARDDDWVLVHDAARCLLRPAWVERLIEACLGDEVGGLLALPLADTLKHAAAGRAARWRAATVGRADAADVSSRAAAAHWLRPGPKSPTRPAHWRWACARCWCRAKPENFKITWPADLDLADRLLRTRENAA